MSDPVDHRAKVAAGLDPSRITEQVDAVLADPLYWFPVRHHSPTTSRHLREAIQARRPKVVFIEGPSEANHLIPHVIDPRTEPPIAIYSSYRDDDNVQGLNGVLSPSDDIPARFAVWYPMTAYSPEYVAMKTAATIKAEVVFIDLPHHARIAPEREGDAPRPPSSPSASDEDHLITSSGFYRSLAEAAGYRSWNEAWDTLFEDPTGVDHEAYRRDLATFCCAARATADLAAEASEGTIERERHFLMMIRKTLLDRQIDPDQAIVVCGGFHLFLDKTDFKPPPSLPEGTVYTTVVPYSYFRVSELAGYGAGNRAPQFYQTCFELTALGRSKDIPLEHSVAVLRQVRKAGDPLSTADAIAVTHHSGMLASLRGRAHPTLDDIHDALITCCCKGNPTEEGSKLLKAMDAAGIGTRIGKVTPSLGRLPVVNDFYVQISALELGEVLDKEKKLTLKLDKRQPMAEKRSGFLHRLKFLEIPFGSMTGLGNDSFGTLFREDWQLKWDPRTEPALIEETLYGDSIESAAMARLKEAIAKAGSNAGETCARLLQAVDMDLPNLIQSAEDACGLAIDADPSFVSLASALHHLSQLERQAEFRGLRRHVIINLISRCYNRACFALPEASSVPDDEARAVVNALVLVADLLQKADRDRFDRGLFASSARRAAEETSVPFLRGAFLGLLCEIRELPAEALVAEVAALAQASTERMITAGDLLDGMFAVSRTSILLGAEALVEAVDDLLKAAEWDPFLMMLPRLRAAFERIAEAQRDSLAATVARKYGLNTASDVRTMTGSLGATALVARLDASVATILADWPF